MRLKENMKIKGIVLDEIYLASSKHEYYLHRSENIADRSIRGIENSLFNAVEGMKVDWISECSDDRKQGLVRKPHYVLK